jgi:hypothetical protein
MKRSPLNRYTPLQRGGPLKRKTKLKPVSAKRAAITGARRQLVKEQLALREHCEAGFTIRRWREDEYGASYADELDETQPCLKRATDIHEPLTRGRGGDILDPENTLALCRVCHDWIHANPLAATELGLLRRADPNNG